MGFCVKKIFPFSSISILHGVHVEKSERDGECRPFVLITMPQLNQFSYNSCNSYKNNNRDNDDCHYDT